jgi:RNA polymerase sigma factor (sigma-70 family)
MPPIKPIYYEYRELLFPIAYNMLGSMSDAEDLVQETMLKWLSIDRDRVADERAYLVRMLVNKCLNFLRDHKREQITDVENQYDDLLTEQLPSNLDLGPSLSLGVQAMLAKLSPLERAVFLLKEVFHFSHQEIAAMLEISEEYCRQVLRRARKHLHANRARYAVNPDQHEQLFRSFVAACQGQDLGSLIEILKEDIAVDIPRPAAAWGNLSQGRVEWAQWLLGLTQNLQSYRVKWWQGLPTLVLYLYQHPPCVIRLDHEGRQISRLQVEVLGQQWTPYLAPNR